MARKPTLSVSPFPARNCWRKVVNGRQHYFRFPLTKAGEQQALRELAELLKLADRERPGAKKYHHFLALFNRVNQWFEVFGTPSTEKRIQKQIGPFIDWLNEQLVGDPSGIMPLGSFPGDSLKAEFFGTEFVSLTDSYKPPKNWQERLRQLDARQNPIKEPQTIGHWIAAYERRTNERSLHAITMRTAADRSFKLKFYKNWADLSAHVGTVDHEHVERFHAALAKAKLAKSSKDDYWRVWRMFVRWAAKQPSCELKMPANIDERELRFREPEGTGRKRQAKKELLWTPDEFRKLLTLPEPFPTFALLYLNCGFRAADVNALKKTDIDLTRGRLIWQRKKTDQLRSPVVNYKLWPKTVEAIRTNLSSDPVFVFADSDGSRFVKEYRDESGRPKVWDALSSRYRQNRKRGWKHSLKKTMDFIRKTGATIIAEHHRGIETVYLGDSLRGVTAISYVFRDGAILPELDEAIDALGQAFGLVKAKPKQTLTLSPELLRKLAAKGKTLEQVIAEL